MLFYNQCFFLFRKLVLLENEKGSEILKKYIFHLMVLYIIWSIPYYHYIVKNFSGRSLFHNLASLVYQYAVTGYSLQTWYIPSLLFGIIVVQTLSERIKNKTLLFGLFVLSAVVLLWGKAYYYLFPQSVVIDALIKTGLISLLRSIPFIFIGMHLARAYLGNMRNRTGDFLYWGVLGGLSLVEIYYLKINKLSLSYDFYVCICPTVYFLVRKCITGKQVTVCVKNLGKMSTIIYFSHIAIRDLILNIGQNVRNGVEFNGFVLWGLTVFFSALLALLIIKMGAKMKLFRYLY